MDYEEFLKRIPKVELHCHLEGCIRPATLVDLAMKHDVRLPTLDPWHVYEVPIVNFFQIYELCCRTMREPSDFARVAYEALEDAHRLGNLRYREMFFNPTLHYESGISYSAMLDGIIEGVRAAEADFGVTTRLIPSIVRTDGPAAARELVAEVVGDRRDEVVGIGMDGQEAIGPPELFADAYQHAKRAGLRRTAHVCEDGPPNNVITCLDVLECDRLDHGYMLLADPSVVERVRDDGIHFSCKVYLHGSWTDHPVREMIEQGLRVNLNTDDPAIDQKNLAGAYYDVAMVFDYDADQMIELCFNGVDAAWMDDEERRSMRSQFRDEINALRAELGVDTPPDTIPYYRATRQTR